MKIERGKVSHKHIYHKGTGEYATIPIHGGEGKDYYIVQLKELTNDEKDKLFKLSIEKGYPSISVYIRGVALS